LSEISPSNIKIIIKQLICFIATASYGTGAHRYDTLCENPVKLAEVQLGTKGK
jgi:hypothetical protein